MKQLHGIQLQILRKLLFARELRYAEMKPDREMENNQFDFHLDQLIKAGFIEKKEKGYALTSVGKEYANRIDTDEVKVMKQARLSAWAVGVRKIKDKWQFLVYTRLKQPFFGCQGFVSGKIGFGERIVQAAERELKEETGLLGTAEIVKMVHYRVFDKKDKHLLEDKIMFLCRIVNPTGKLETESEEGRYEWVDEEKLPEYVTNHFESWEVFAGQVKAVKEFDGNVKIEEIDHWSEKF